MISEQQTYYALWEYVPEESKLFIWMTKLEIGNCETDF